MSYYYVPNEIKPICNVCKYVVGAPFWIISSFTDEVLSSGKTIPLDVTQTGGTIPSDIGNFDRLREVINSMEE